MQNTGNVGLTGVTLTDNLFDLVAKGCSIPTTLDVGGSFNCDYSDTAKVGTTTNTATADSNETPSVDDSASVNGQEPVLNLEKEVSVNGGAYSHSGSANPGDTLTYRLTITNTGDAAATGESVTDDLSGVLAHATWNSDASASSGSSSFTSPNLTWSGISIAAGGGTATLTFSVTLASVFPDGTTQLPNTAVEANSENCPSATSENPDCSTDTTVTAAPALDYLKLVSTSANGPFVASNTAVPGDTLYYKITVSNSGNANANSQTVTDVLSSALVANSTAFDISTCNVTCLYDTGSRTITWTGVDINAGGSATLTFRVTLNDTFPSGQTQLDNSVVCPLVNNEPNPDCTTTTIVTASPILNLEKQVSVNGGAFSHSGSADPGDILTYKLTITNTGNAAASGESVTDNLTSVLAHASWDDSFSQSSGSVDFTSPNLTWSGISIAAGGGTATLTFSVTLDASGWAAGTTDLPNAAVEANSENCPSATSENPDCSTDTTVTTGTDLGITKAVDPSTIPGGASTGVSYTIVVSNSGDGDTDGNVLVTDDDFPAFYSITGVTCAPTNATCDAAHLTGSGIDLGTLAAGGSVEITVSGTAAPNNTTDVGQHVNTAYACEQVVEGDAICVHAPATLTVTLDSTCPPSTS